jgi:threonine/homoserine/homoserine lactone efflux protein
MVSLTLTLFLATALAGFAYVISPGPAFLAVFTLTAAQGRGAATRFLVGHTTGDVVWSALALAALVGANRLGPTLFDLLGLVCGCYLVFLGGKALLAHGDGTAEPVGARRPGWTGVVFGLTNPKAYPVATAMFAAIALPYAGALDWADAPKLLLAALVGFVPGYAAIVFAAGLPMVRRFFARHGVAVSRVVGAVFVVFGSRILIDSGRHLAMRGPTLRVG